VFAREAVTGAISFLQVEERVGGVEGLRTPGSVTVSPDGRHAYVIGNAAVVVFEREATSGTLRFVEIHRDGQDGVDGLSGASSVTMSPGGQYLYVKSSGSIAVFARAAATGTLDFVAVQQDMLGGGFEDFELSPDGRHVYVTAPSSVAAYRVNAQ
jgi:6-phosphogluconolactonase (cycloisomerase 2 family)